MTEDRIHCFISMYVIAIQTTCLQRTKTKNQTGYFANKTKKHKFGRDGKNERISDTLFRLHVIAFKTTCLLRTKI